MAWLGLLAIVVALLALRQSLVLLLAVVAAYVHIAIAGSKIEFLIQDFWFAVDRELLLSIPLFMLAGNVMSHGTIAKRMVNFMQAFVSPVPGGLAIACILSCAAFAAINGSSIVTMLAIGSIMYPALISNGYSQRFAVGAIASAGTLGIIIPPSIPLILYGIVTEEDISKLFVAGIGPGLLLTALFSAYAFWVNRHRPSEPFNGTMALKATWGGIFAILLPVIMIGGIYSGWFSPTEAGAVSLAYALVVEMLVHAKEGAGRVARGAGPLQRIRHYLRTREMSVRDVIRIVLETTKLLATLLPLLCIAGSLNTILDQSGIPRQVVEGLSSTISSGPVMMLGINVLLLVTGMFMDVGSSIMILGPLLKPLAEVAGFDPIHFGIIMIANLEIGYLTPPVGLNLIVAMSAFRTSFAVVVRAVVPFVIIMLVWLTIVVMVPALSLYLVGK